MAVGGPASFGIGLLSGLARAQQHARQQAGANYRFQVELALKQLKERKQEEDAIAKEQRSLSIAAAEARAAQSDIDIIHAEIERVRNSPGAPFKDAALEGHLEEARSRLEDAHAELQERQGKLQDLIADRDARVRGAIPPTRTGGFFGYNQSEVPPEKRTDEQKAAYKAAIVKGEREQGAEFNKAASPIEREIRQAEAGESRENAKIKGFETAEEEGRKQQGILRKAGEARWGGENQDRPRENTRLSRNSCRQSRCGRTPRVPR
ncbi:MAG TPA: hypothetical protein VGP28_04580 [Methylocella sp.]|nr:hypothetical protein [Methylocella sp.]